MMIYWISWIQRTEDFRPLTYPPRDEILGWWCSGEDSDGNAIICSAVHEDDPTRACVAIFAEWPEAKEDMAANGWRLFEHHADDFLPSDRFPLSDWMVSRFAALQPEV